MNLDQIRFIQGGMGPWVSGFRMAREVSLHEGWMGTISLTAIDRVIAWHLQSGDPGGHFIRALNNFPYPAISKRVIAKYYKPDGNREVENVPKYSLNPTRDLIDLLICGSFSAVWLAKSGHNNPISVNILEKIQMPTIYVLIGAILAGVDCITMGAGIPDQIPSVLESIISGNIVSYKIDVIGSQNNKFQLEFNSEEYFGEKLSNLTYPEFLPIISSNLLANFLIKRCSRNKISGFVIEFPTAGGHNAPPRGYKNGEYIYGEKDKINLDEIKNLGVRFWLAGGYASREKYEEAISLGANGVQIATPFALCEESEIDEQFKKRLRSNGFNNKQIVFTSDYSPTKYPFKVAKLDGSLSEDEVFDGETRGCYFGCLVTFYRDDEGNINSRCPAEPIELYIEKGGNREDTVGTRCLCRGLFSNIGKIEGRFSQPALITLGEDLSFINRLMKNSKDNYTVDDVCRKIFL